MSVTRKYTLTRVKGALVPPTTRVPSSIQDEGTFEEIRKEVFMPALTGNLGGVATRGPGALFLSLEDLTVDQLDNLTPGNLDLLVL